MGDSKARVSGRLHPKERKTSLPLMAFGLVFGVWAIWISWKKLKVFGRAIHSIDRIFSRLLKLFFFFFSWDSGQDLENHTEKSLIPQGLRGGVEKQNGICKTKHITWSKVWKLTPRRAWLKGIKRESHTREKSRSFFFFLKQGTMVYIIILCVKFDWLYVLYYLPQEFSYLGKVLQIGVPPSCPLHVKWLGQSLLIIHY